MAKNHHVVAIFGQGEVMVYARLYGRQHFSDAIDDLILAPEIERMLDTPEVYTITPFINLLRHQM